MKICAITASAGRYSCLSRNLRMFLNQDYDNCIQLIYQNSPVPLELHSDVPKDKVILINNHLDLQTGQRYETLGAIYRDALTYVPADVDVINHMDDDDVFLPYHISKGAEGMQKGGKVAYKPQTSYFISNGHLTRMINTMEPSIFVKKSHLEQHGYGQETSAQHLQWVNPLVYGQGIFVDPEGLPTMLYDWSTTGVRVFKTSGNAGNPDNFNNYHNFSKDYGNGILEPASKEYVQTLYDLLNEGE